MAGWPFGGQGSQRHLPGWLHHRGVVAVALRDDRGSQQDAGAAPDDIPDVAVALQGDRGSQLVGDVQGGRRAGVAVALPGGRGSQHPPEPALQHPSCVAVVLRGDRGSQLVGDRPLSVTARCGGRAPAWPRGTAPAGWWACRTPHRGGRPPGRSRTVTETPCRTPSGRGHSSCPPGRPWIATAMSMRLASRRVGGGRPSGRPWIATTTAPAPQSWTTIGGGRSPLWPRIATTSATPSLTACQVAVALRGDRGSQQPLTERCPAPAWRSPSGAAEDRNTRSADGRIRDLRGWRSPSRAAEDRNGYVTAVAAGAASWRSPFGAAEDRNAHAWSYSARAARSGGCPPGQPRIAT